ncbi:MAG: ankyrin repeat domain-containing protein [Oligoflexia bacterium]|nr:ankyrin repeat domain-containing protein [Oligoflexia bacterium]
MRGISKYLIVFIFLALPVTAWTATTAKIEAIGGAETVFIKRAGSQVKLKAGDLLQLGDELNTDAVTAVDIRFEDNTILRVGLNSSYRFQEESGSGFFHKLLQGAVRVLVPSKKDGNKTSAIKFKMQTPEGTIGVRGTEFVVVRKEGETNLKGLTGEVVFGALEVDLANDEELVKIKKGYESSITSGAKKPTAPKAFVLKNYLRDIDSKSGIFGPLAARTGNELKARSPVVVEQPKSKVIAKAKPPKMVKPKVVSEKPKSEKSEDSKVDYNQILLSSAKSGNLQSVAKAIENRADVNIRDEDGHSSLHYAAYSSNLEMMQLLIDNKANVNAKDNLGRTPIMNVALETGNVDAARLLVENKASLTEKDKQGLSVFDLADSNAENQGWAELIKYLNSRK